MALFDLLGRRWALSVLWALRSGPLNFRERREAGLVVTGEGGYELTEQGDSLLAAGRPLVAWAGDWAKMAAGPRSTDEDELTRGQRGCEA